MLINWVKVGIGIAVATAMYFAVSTYNEQLRDQGRKEVQREWDKDKADRISAALAQKVQADKDRAALEAQQQENDRDAQLQIDAARADAARARSLAQRLRDAADARARSDLAHQATRAQGISPPAEASCGVLADVLKLADERAGILAEYADRARIAGQQCERDYDAITGAGEPKVLDSPPISEAPDGNFSEGT